MLIYRNDGNLHCVSKKALKLAGYSDISQFLSDHNDYSELFVKKPGYIYNFENFSWLSFLRNAKTEQKKVLIATSDKATYECELDLEVLFPVDFEEGASEFYYQIDFKNMRLLTGTGDTVTAIEVPSFKSTIPEPSVAVTGEEAVKTAFEEPVESETASSDTFLFEEPEAETSGEKTESDILFETEPMEEPSAPSSEKIEPLELVDFSFGEESEEKPEAEKNAESTETEITPPKAPVFPEAGVPDIGLKEDVPAVSAPEKETVKAKREETAASPSIEMPDIRKVAGTLGLPETMVKAFVKEFVETYFEDLDEVRSAIAANETQALRKEAMKLKGIAANLMMFPLVETLEKVLTSEKDEEAKSVWSEVDAYMNMLAATYSPKKTAQKESEAEISVASEPAEVAQEIAPAREPAVTTSEKRLHLEVTESDETIEFDPAEAANALGLPESLIIEFVNDFIQQAREERTNFEKAYEAEDIKTINETAHKLKGVAANLRIEDMRALMENAQHAKTLDEVEKSLTDFYRKLAALTKSMAKEYA